MLNTNNDTSLDSILYPEKSSKKKLIPLATLNIGMILDDKYEIKREIARGGMGIVYEAYHRYVHRRVAIKVVLSSKMNTAQLERFKKEIESYSCLSHPNIIQIYDAGMYNNSPYLVMEYIEGIDICKYVAQQREAQKALENTDPNMYWKLCASLISQVALGLDHIHKHSIIHRDIKPSNIMVRPNGSPVIIDLGLAKFLQENSVRLTMSGDHVGTPQYMPLEQVQGTTGIINAQSDVYSLGLVLYELLTGKIAYSGTTIMEIFYKIMEYYPPRPREINPQVPKELDEITMHAIEKQQKDRFANAQEFSDALKKYLSDLNEQEVTKVDLNDAIKILSDALISKNNSTISPTQLSNASLKGKSAKLKTQLATIKKQQRLQEQEKIRKQSKNNLYYIAGAVALFLLAIIIGSLTGTKKENIYTPVVEQKQENIANTPATEQKQENINNTPVVEQKQENIANTLATEQNTQENINNTPATEQKKEEAKLDFKTAEKLFFEGKCAETGRNEITDTPIQQDYSKALEKYNTVINNAQEEDPSRIKAIYRLAGMYYYGKGVKNTTRAEDLLVSIKDYELAQFPLGVIYYKKENFEEARKYFEKVANNGHSEAQLLLGYMYYCGMGGDKNFEEARKYFEKVANNGHATYDEIIEAKLYLGVICYDNKEFDDAKSRFESVINIPEAKSYLELIRGNLVKAKKLLENEEYLESKKLFESIIDKSQEPTEVAEAQLCLGIMYAEGLVKEENKKQDTKKISKADTKKQDTQKTSKSGTKKQDTKKLDKENTKKTKKEKEAEAQRAKEQQEREQEEIKRQEAIERQNQYDKKAIEYFEKAAEKDNAEAQLYLAYMYNIGKGVKQDYAKAKSFYERAQKQSNREISKQASDMLEKMKKLL